MNPSDQSPSPWEKMRESQKRQPQFEAKQEKMSVKQAFRYLLFVYLPAAWKLQFPDADEVPDSGMYLGYLSRSQSKASRMWGRVRRKDIGPVEYHRKPIVILNRRLGIVGTFGSMFVALLLIQLIRMVFS